MANIKLVKYIKSTQKFPKTFDDYLNYFIFVFPLAFLGIGLPMLYNYFKFHSGFPVLLVSMLFLTIGIFGIYATFKRLSETISFEVIENCKNYDIETIADKLKDNFKLTDIKIDLNVDLIVAFTKTSAFSWGEKLTIIIDNNNVLVNSRPAGSRQPVTIIKDKSNIKRLRLLLE